MGISDIPFPRFIGIKHIKTHVLTKDLILEQWKIQKGTVVKVFQDQNFGYVVLPKNLVKDVYGHTVPKRVFKY